MFANDDCTVFLSLAGAMVPAGMRRIVSDLIRDGYVDALVTTGANLTHDAIEAIGGKHHHGRTHDPEKTPASTTRGSATRASTASTTSTSRRSTSPPSRGTCARRCSRRSKPIRRRAETAPSELRDLTRELGRANAAVNERDDVTEDAGVAAAAYDCDVPVYCPAVQDSVLGLQAWMYAQTADFTLDALDDMTELTDLAFADDAGCLLVGGGVPKNFTLQTMLVTPPRAYDYAVQITMDPEATGGSPAPP